MQKEFVITTNKKYEVFDISEQVNKIVNDSGTRNGMCFLYVPHATAAIIINENDDPKICDDFLDAINKMVPEGIWRHDRIDNNGAAHIKAAMIGPSESIPIVENKLRLGTWQDPMIVDFDGPKKRKVIVTIITDN